MHANGTVKGRSPARMQFPTGERKTPVGEGPQSQTGREASDRNTLESESIAGATPAKAVICMAAQPTNNSTYAADLAMARLPLSRGKRSIFSRRDTGPAESQVTSDLAGFDARFRWCQFL